MNVDKQQAEAMTIIITECEERLAAALGGSVSIRVITPAIVFDDRNHKAIQIIKNVADAFDISVNDIRSKRRKAPAPEARFMCMRFLNELHFRHKEIQQQFEGLVNHTSVVYGLKKFEELYQTDEKYRYKYTAVSGNLNSI